MSSPDTPAQNNVDMCNYYIYTKKADSSHIALRFTYGITSISLFKQRWYTTLISRKLLIILLLLLSYSGYKYFDFEVIPSISETNIEAVRKNYYGPIDSQKILTLREEQKKRIPKNDRFQFLLKNIHTLTEKEQIEMSTLQNEAQLYYNINIILDEIEELQTQDADTYMAKNGYDLLFSTQSNYTVFMHFILSISAIALFISIAIHPDYHNKMMHLYRSSVNGKHKLFHINHKISIFGSCILIFIIYGMFILKINKVYPLFTFDFPITNIFASQLHIHFFASMGILLFTHFIFYNFIACLIHYLSTKYDIYVIIPFILFFGLLMIGLYMVNPAYSPILLLTNQLFIHLVSASMYLCGMILTSVYLYYKTKNQYI